MALIALTERPYFQRAINGFQILDPLQTVEKVFKDRGTVLLIFLYLTKCYHEKRKLNPSQLEDLDYVLRACRYDAIDFKEILSKDQVEEMISHFFGKKDLRRSNSFIQPRSFNSIYDDIISSIPDEMKDI